MDTEILAQILDELRQIRHDLQWFSYYQRMGTNGNDGLHDD
jgi:hypothetical protein